MVPTPPEILCPVVQTPPAWDLHVQSQERKTWTLPVPSRRDSLTSPMNSPPRLQVTEPASESETQQVQPGSPELRCLKPLSCSTITGDLVQKLCCFSLEDKKVITFPALDPGYWCDDCQSHCISATNLNLYLKRKYPAVTAACQYQCT